MLGHKYELCALPGALPGPLQPAPDSLRPLSHLPYPWPRGDKRSIGVDNGGFADKRRASRRAARGLVLGQEPCGNMCVP